MGVALIAGQKFASKRVTYHVWCTDMHSREFARAFHVGVLLERTYVGLRRAPAYYHSLVPYVLEYPVNPQTHRTVITFWNGEAQECATLFETKPLLPSAYKRRRCADDKALNTQLLHGLKVSTTALLMGSSRCGRGLEGLRGLELRPFLFACCARLISGGKTRNRPHLSG